MASPTPLPSNVKKLRGTYRKDRAAVNEMTPETMQQVPLPPATLAKKAQEVWFKAAMELQKLHMLHAVDLELLAAYCHQVSIMDEAMFFINKHGKVMKLRNKVNAEYYQKNPWINIYNEALTYANRLAQQFGFTPSARSRISAPVVEKKEKDPWDEF
jgi:P27 family predicted phage terminase small subunit